MKKTILLIGLFIAASVVYAGNPTVVNYNVTLTTHSTQAIGENLGRRYLAFHNSDATYEIYIATAAITSSTFDTVGAWVIEPGETFEDDGLTYLSTWYATSSNAAIAGKLAIMEKE